MRRILILLALAGCGDNLNRPHEAGDAWHVEAIESTCAALDRSPTTITAIDVVHGECLQLADGDVMRCRWFNGNHLTFDFVSGVATMSLVTTEDPGWCETHFEIIGLRDPDRFNQ